MSLRRTASLAGVILALAAPAAAVAGDAAFVGWTALLPALSMPHDTTSADDCVAGRVACVDKTIRQMTRRFDALAASCDHNTIFSLTYLRVTEEYRRTIAEPFFDLPVRARRAAAAFDHRHPCAVGRVRCD